MSPLAHLLACNSSTALAHCRSKRQCYDRQTAFEFAQECNANVTKSLALESRIDWYAIPVRETVGFIGHADHRHEF